MKLSTSIFISFLILLITIPAFSSDPETSSVMGMTFVRIPSGRFLMGSPEDEIGGKDDEKPQHLVQVRSFEMMTTEVTQAMWEKVMGVTMDEQIQIKTGGESLYKISGNNFPVYYVSWADAQEFIAKLNELDDVHNYFLPTEAQWEYACRAGSKTRYYWGDDPDDEFITEYAWVAENVHEGNSAKFVNVHEVAQKKPNAWGLYDMAGNLLEWCTDSYIDNYNNSPVDSDAVILSDNEEKVARGSDGGVSGRYGRSANRFHHKADFANYNIGFRVARVKK